MDDELIKKLAEHAGIGWRVLEWEFEELKKFAELVIEHNAMRKDEALSISEDELDIMWNKALTSPEARGCMYIRYAFAKLLIEHIFNTKHGRN